MKLPQPKATSAARPDDPDAATRPYYIWLLISLFMEYARPASFIPILRIPFLISAIPITLLLVVLFSGKARSFRDVLGDTTTKWMLAYVAMITLSVTYAIVHEFAFNMWKLVAGYFILFVLLSRLVTSERRFHGVVITLLVAHLFLIAMNPNVILDPETRNYVVGATFLGDGNDFSLSLVLLLPCVLEVTLKSSRWWARLLLWLGSLITLFAIIASQSRGATLALAAVGIYLWLVSPRKLAVLSLMAGVVLVVFLYAPDAYFKRMNTIADYQNEGSAMGRIWAWRASVKMAKDNPLLGIGVGNFPVAYGTKYKPPEATNTWKTAHSSFFLVLGEMGLPGLVLLVGLIISNIVGNSRLRKAIQPRAGPRAGPASEASVRAVRQMRLLTAAIIGYTVAGAFLSAAYYPHIFVLSGLMVATRLNLAHALRSGVPASLDAPGAAVAARKAARGALRGRIAVRPVTRRM